MLYSVIENFGPGEKGWEEFIKGHYIKNLTSFDSVDHVLCPSKFTPESLEDWENCIDEDFMIEYISNLDYATKVQKSYPNSKLVGLECEINCDAVKTLIGYDILDGYNDVSLITNWGPHDEDHPLKTLVIQNNGLLSSYEIAKKALELLTRSSKDDDHVKGCKIWAVHNPTHK